MSKGVDLPGTEKPALICYVIDSRAAYTACGIGGTDLRLLRSPYSPPLHPTAGVAVRYGVSANYLLLRSILEDPPSPP
jgi:hypothetical protein